VGLIEPGVLLVIAGLAITIRPRWLRQREIFRRGGDIYLVRHGLSFP